MAPPAVTVTSTAPADPAGLVALQLVVELQVTAVPAAAPKSTVVPVVEKPVPVIVTTVPPASGPAVGLILATAGPEVYVNLSAALVAEVAPPAVTVTSTAPADPAGLVALQLVVELQLTAVPAVRAETDGGSGGRKPGSGDGDRGAPGQGARGRADAGHSWTRRICELVGSAGGRSCATCSHRDVDHPGALSRAGGQAAGRRSTRHRRARGRAEIDGGSGGRKPGSGDGDRGAPGQGARGGCDTGHCRCGRCCVVGELIRGTGGRRLPPAVTVTSTSPAVVATGLVALQLVVELQVTAVPAVVPKLIVVPVVPKPVPVMVTGVPPAKGPEVGVILVTVGAAAAAA